jgi:hypothetical protein
VDSARGASFYGTLTRALSGDVEMNEDHFRPFQGTLGDEGVARFSVEVKAGGPPVEIAGRASGDRWSGTSLVWGGTELVTPDRAWEGRRTP